MEQEFVPVTLSSRELVVLLVFCGTQQSSNTGYPTLYTVHASMCAMEHDLFKWNSYLLHTRKNLKPSTDLVIAEKHSRILDKRNA